MAYRVVNIDWMSMVLERTYKIVWHGKSFAFSIGDIPGCK
jgi:hypothetical protein